MANDIKGKQLLESIIKKLVQEEIASLNEKHTLTKGEVANKNAKRKAKHYKEKDVRNADGNKDVNNTKHDKEVINTIKKGPYTKAELMRRLWKPESQEEDDELRSLFSKKLNNKKNDDGVPYKFNKDEINSLSHIIDTAN